MKFCSFTYEPLLSCRTFAYLTKRECWQACDEPKNVVAFNVSLFFTLIAASFLQALLCASQMINGLFGCLCGVSKWEVKTKTLHLAFPCHLKFDPLVFRFLLLPFPFLIHRRRGVLLTGPQSIICIRTTPEELTGDWCYQGGGWDHCSFSCIKLLLWWCCLW